MTKLSDLKPGMFAELVSVAGVRSGLEDFNGAIVVVTHDDYEARATVVMPRNSNLRAGALVYSNWECVPMRASFIPEDVFETPAPPAPESQVEYSDDDCDWYDDEDDDEDDLEPYDTWPEYDDDDEDDERYYEPEEDDEDLEAFEECDCSECVRAREEQKALQEKVDAQREYTYSPLYHERERTYAYANGEKITFRRPIGVLESCDGCDHVVLNRDGSPVKVNLYDRSGGLCTISSLTGGSFEF